MSTEGIATPTPLEIGSLINSKPWKVESHSTENGLVGLVLYLVEDEKLKEIWQLKLDESCEIVSKNQLQLSNVVDDNIIRQQLLVRTDGKMLKLNTKSKPPEEQEQNVNTILFEKGAQSQDIVGTLTLTENEHFSQFVFAGNFVCWKDIADEEFFVHFFSIQQEQEIEKL